MPDTELFKGISEESIAEMMNCFKPERRTFRRGETVMVYASELTWLCVLLRGTAHLYCMDSDGEYVLLETYRPGDIFGEVFAMPYGGLGYAVEADSECEVLFIRFSCICGRCPRACRHHTQPLRAVGKEGAVARHANKHDQQTFSAPQAHRVL